MPSSTSSHSRPHTSPPPLPVLPIPAHVSPSFGNYPQPLQRIQASRFSHGSSWGSDVTASSEWFIINNQVVLPVQVGGDAGVHPAFETRPRAHDDLRRSPSGWTNRGTSTHTTVSSYTSIYPLSSQSSDSHGSVFDMDALTGSYRGHSLYSSACTREQDWAPWLSSSSHSPPPQPKSPLGSDLGSDFFADQVGAAGLPPSPRIAGQRRIRRSVLVANNTFYLPPLVTEDLPSLASPPRRSPKPHVRPDSPPVKAETSSAPQSPKSIADAGYPHWSSWTCLPQCGATDSALDEDSAQLIRKLELNPIPKPTMTAGLARSKSLSQARPRPKAPAQFKHAGYRISLVEDRRWRANILNQAVTQSLASPLMPPAPSFNKSRPRRLPPTAYHQLQ